jgi:hypothetical protein
MLEADNSVWQQAIAHQQKIFLGKGWTSDAGCEL